MAKKPETMVVTIPESGRKLTVPRGLSGAALQRHVQGVLAAEAEAAAQAEAAALAATQQAEDDRFEALQKELEAERAKQEVLHNEIAELKRASPEAASMATILSQMTREANAAFDRNQKLLAAMNRFVDKKGDEIADVAVLLAQQNETIDTEKAAKRDAGRRTMDDIRAQQGLPRLHPELVQGVGDE